MENKKARFNYTLLDTYQAGIVLTGLEVKALRDNKCSFGDSYCIIDKGEVIVRNLHISLEITETSLRDKKLLLNKKEISKITREIKEKGLTLVPVRFYFNKTGLIKFDIALAKGKKAYDKRDVIKKRENERNLKNI